MIDLSCDYNCGCAPEILSALAKANEEQHATYGFDAISARAKEKIRAAVGNPDADVYFLVGGTQTNATVLASLLRPWEGVISAASGHIAVHESGAVEATGHKVLTIAGDAAGKLAPQALAAYLKGFYADETYPHMVQPGAVYLSQPTEYGGLYTRFELKAIRALCDRYALRLYVDGARLAYALGSPETDVTLRDLGALCDAFYIGGTKCGALLGEAVVFREKQRAFFTAHKQRGALLAKGYLLGLQFDTLFTDDLYLRLGAQGTRCAIALREALRAQGVAFSPESETNQQFPILSAAQLEKLDGKIGYEIWQRLPDGGAVIRLCCSWRSTEKDTEAVLSALRGT